MENQHQKITGYRDLSQEDIDMMNEGKELAIKVGEWIAKLQATPTPDQRCVAIGKTELQTGFMWAIRGIAQSSTF